MAVSRTTFRRRSTAKKRRGAGRRVYKVDGGYRVSPECPRAGAKRRELIKGRTKTRRRGRKTSTLGGISVVWVDNVAPF